MNETSTKPRRAYTVRLPAEIAERLDFLADAEVRTAQNLIEVLVREALDARESRGSVGDIHLR